MKKENKELLEVLNGQEVMKIGDSNIRRVMNAYNLCEYGTIDIKEILRKEGF
jgi:hypothetical protein